jgi:hypothetical protein
LAGITIEGLFGNYCSGVGFSHDAIMEQRARVMQLEELNHETQVTTTSALSSLPDPLANSSQQAGSAAEDILDIEDQLMEELEADPDPYPGKITDSGIIEPETNTEDGIESPRSPEEDSDAVLLQNSQQSELSEMAYEIRLNAFRAILNNTRSNDYQEISLISTTDNHIWPEDELGG